MTHLEFAFGLLPISIIVVSFIVTLFIQIHASFELYDIIHPDIYTF